MEIDRKKEFEKKEEEVEEEEEEGPLDFLDVKEYLILKKDGEEGPDIRGGPVDALIVHASKANKNGMGIYLCDFSEVIHRTYENLQRE